MTWSPAFSRAQTRAFSAAKPEEKVAPREFASRERISDAVKWVYQMHRTTSMDRRASERSSEHVRVWGGWELWGSERTEASVFQWSDVLLECVARRVTASTVIESLSESKMKHFFAINSLFFEINLSTIHVIGFRTSRGKGKPNTQKTLVTRCHSLKNVLGKGH